MLATIFSWLSVLEPPLFAVPIVRLMLSSTSQWRNCLVSSRMFPVPGLPCRDSPSPGRRAGSRGAWCRGDLRMSLLSLWRAVAASAALLALYVSPHGCVSPYWSQWVAALSSSPIWSSKLLTCRSYPVAVGSSLESAGRVVLACRLAVDLELL